MKLSKIIEHLYLNVFIAVVESDEGIDIRVELIKGSHIKATVDKHFDELGHQAFEFIKNYCDDTPFYYIALLCSTTKQGALPTCATNKSNDLVDLSDKKTLCYNKKWMVYVEKEALKEIKARYRSVGIDFLFSPFFILSKMYGDKIVSSLALYVLLQENQLSIAVFEKGELLYALHHSSDDDPFLQEEEHSGVSVDFELEGDGIEEGIHLDDIDMSDDLGDIDMLDEFDSIEDLDEIEEIEEFEDSVTADEHEQPTSEVPLSNKDYKRFLLIQAALQQFYGDERYETAFIESCYIANATSEGEDLKKLLNEELFMDVILRQCVMIDEVMALAKVEQKDAA